MSLHIDILTLFPDVLKPFLNESILKRAKDRKKVVINVHDLKGELIVINRSKDRFKSWTKQLPLTTGSFNNLTQLTGELLINATSVGMDDNNESCVDINIIKNFSVIFDVVLNPQTQLIRQAKRLKKKIITGMDMCLYQAAAQFKIYTGLDAPLAQMIKLMEI